MCINARDPFLAHSASHLPFKWISCWDEYFYVDHIKGGAKVLVLIEIFFACSVLHSKGTEVGMRLCRQIRHYFFKRSSSVCFLDLHSVID